jgi:hypothetical protein
MIFDFKIFETKQEAESFLSKNNIDKDNESFIKIKEISKPLPSLIGILTKLHFDKNVKLNILESIIKKCIKLKNELKRDGISIQDLFIDSYKNKEVPEEYIEDILDKVELRGHTLRFINDIQYSSVRNELKERYYDKIENGIVSIRKIKNWQKNLEFISKKSARYKSGSDVIKVFKKMINNIIGGFNPEEIVKKINSDPGAVVVYNKDGFVVAQIFSYETSCSLGSSSWCISTNNYYFKQYVDLRNNRQQYFVWDTSKDPSDNYSLMGITLEYSGRRYTSHLKNDIEFNHINYFDQLVKKGECDKDLFDLLTSEVNKKDPIISLKYLLYGDVNISVKEFKEIFKNLWDKSEKKTIEDFNKLYEIVIIILRKKIIKIYSLENEREYIILKRIIEKLVELLYKISSVEEFINYFLNKEESDKFSYDVYFIKKITEDSKYASINFDKDTQVLIDLYFLKFHMSDNKEIIYDISNLDDINISLLLSSKSMVSGEKWDIKTNLNKNILFLLSNIQYSKLKYIKIKTKTNLKSLNLSFNKKGDYVNLENRFYTKLNNINNIDVLTIKAFNNFGNLYIKEPKIKSVDTLIIDMQYNDLGSNIYLMDENSFKLNNLILKNIKQPLSNVNIPNSVNELTVEKCKFRGNSLENIKHKKLIIKHSYIKDIINALNFENTESVEISNDVYYILSNEEKEFLKQYNLKITGGLPFYESFNSKFLRLMNNNLSKEEIRTLYDVMSKRNIDLNKIEDKYIEMLPSIYLGSYLEKKEVEGNSYILIGVKEGGEITTISSIKYFKNKNSPRSIWNILYYDDSKLRKVSWNINGITQDSDYVLLIDEKNIKNKYSSSELKIKRKKDKEYSPHFDKILPQDKLNKRLDTYIKDKYLFNVNGNKETIDYLNKIIKKTVCVTTTSNNSARTSDLITYISEHLKHSDYNRTKQIEVKIENLLKDSSISNMRKKFYKDIYYEDNQKVKIYPDQELIDKLIEQIVNINKVISSYFENNKIDISYINDLDVLRAKVGSIEKFINRYIKIYDLYYIDMAYSESGSVGYFSMTVSKENSVSRGSKPKQITSVEVNKTMSNNIDKLKDLERKTKLFLKF